MRERQGRRHILHGAALAGGHKHLTKLKSTGEGGILAEPFRSPSSPCHRPREAASYQTLTAILFPAGLLYYPSGHPLIPSRPKYSTRPALVGPPWWPPFTVCSSQSSVPTGQVRTLRGVEFCEIWRTWSSQLASCPLRRHLHLDVSTLGSMFGRRSRVVAPLRRFVRHLPGARCLDVGRRGVHAGLRQTRRLS